jgi:lysyl-tRNA synthetase, class II
MSDQQRPADEIEARHQKLEELRSDGTPAYAERYETTHELSDALALADDVAGVRVAGRVVGLRYFGKLAFGHLFDHTGRLQFALQKNTLGEDFQRIKRLVDVGDYVGVEGEMMTTRTGEKTINAKSFAFLSKALRPLPEKFHGLTDQEQRYRKRYLDLIASPESMDRFKLRTRLVRALRDYLDDNGFMEIDTPVLTNKASGAMATPFVTHYNALDMDVYLRIAPETYLKRAIAGGLTRVYEFARCFRNEGIDPSHLPDFTMLEYYASYWNYEDNMRFTEAMIKHLLDTVLGSRTVSYQGQEISFDGEWPRMSFRDLLINDCGIDIEAVDGKQGLMNAIAERGIELETDFDPKTSSFGTLIDILYKKVSRPKIVNPLFLTKHPIDVSPLARRNDENPAVVDRFQLVVNGWEIVNAYSELVDPVDQAERFRQQQAARAAGDTEAMEIDNDFLACMEYGMPPMSGWGMGIDRVVALLTDARTLRDVVLFPLLRPE